VTSDYFAHESSYIDEGASIGKGTRIWHFCHVMPGAVIGERCNLGQNVVVMPRVVIGNNVKIQNNVSVYEGVVLEDDVFCGPSCVFTNVINPRSEVNRKEEYRPTLVRRGATIGANATVVCGAELGEYCFIGAGAVVTGDVPPYGLMVGVPARQVGWVCRCGVTLQLQQGQGRCSACGRQYREAEGRLGLVDPAA
jgi:UDP-2-acetamido-3-amino-2,3-dideoxy-glucuronate N-acetyltransferase